MQNILAKTVNHAYPPMWKVGWWWGRGTVQLKIKLSVTSNAFPNSILLFFFKQKVVTRPFFLLYNKISEHTNYFCTIFILPKLKKYIMAACVFFFLLIHYQKKGTFLFCCTFKRTSKQLKNTSSCINTASAYAIMNQYQVTIPEKQREKVQVRNVILSKAITWICTLLLIFFLAYIW